MYLLKSIHTIYYFFKEIVRRYFLLTDCIYWNLCIYYSVHPQPSDKKDLIFLKLHWSIIKIIIKSIFVDYSHSICSKVRMCVFNIFATKVYWNDPLGWVFSCKFASYFQNIFSQEHLWVAPSISLPIFGLID